MVLERLSANVSGRLRRRNGAGIQMRARLLHRIGSRDFFLKLPSPSVKKFPVKKEAQPSSSDRPTTIVSSRLPDHSIRASYTKALRTTTTTQSPNQKKVQFQHSVTVVEIPSREAYTGQQKKALWRSSEEIRFLVRRNRQEYIYDGRDWTKVREEHEMVWDPVTQEYVHPATWEEPVRFRSSAKARVHRKTQLTKKRLLCIHQH
jgi:hypothetical protein